MPRLSLILIPWTPAGGKPSRNVCFARAIRWRHGKTALKRPRKTLRLTAAGDNSSPSAMAASR
jgi:hypothetical protein